MIDEIVTGDSDTDLDLAHFEAGLSKNQVEECCGWGSVDRWA